MTTFYSLCNYCMTHIMVHIFHFDSTLQRYLLSLCHCLWACTKTTLWLYINPGHIVCSTFVHFHLQEQPCFKKKTGSSHTLINKSQSEGFLNRVEFLTWKLALNPICTGRHILGQRSATADGENEPSISYNVARLLSYLPPTYSNLAYFRTLWNLQTHRQRRPNISQCWEVTSYM